MKKLSEKIKKYLGFARMILFIFLVIICGFLIQDRKLQKSQIKDLSGEIEEMKRKKVEVDALKEEIRQISKYSAYEFSYTSILCFSDQNNFMGVNIPLTGNSFIATVDGKMNIGIDADKIEFSVFTDSEGNIAKVTLAVPYSEILDNYTIQESLEIYDEKNNIFNPVKVADYKKLILEAEEKEEQKVMEGDLLQKSDEEIKFFLTSHLQAVYGNNVKIEYTLF